MDEFLELLAKLDEDITALTDEELATAREEITTYGRTLKDAETADADAEAQLVEDAKALAAAVTAIDAELEGRTTAAAESAQARDEAFAAFGEETTDEEAGETAEDTTATEETEETVVAAAPALADIATRRPRRTPDPDPVEPAVIVAAAVGDRQLGNRFADSDELAKAMWDAKRRGPNGSSTVARIALDTYGDELGSIPEENWVSLHQMQRDFGEARMAMDPVLAAGFCAPAEPIYEYLQQGSRDGIIQLPTKAARRGQLVYPEIFNIRDLQVQNGIGWETTATMDEDSVEKPCYTVDCGTGATFDVKAYSTCLTFSNFDSQFWPERVTHVNGQSLIAHDHEVNLALITAIVADGRTEAAVDAHAGGGTWAQLSNSLALHGAYVRNRYRLPISSVLEAGIPAYVLDALVADQVARSSTLTPGMARAEIEAALARMRINVQWLYDWQELGEANWPATYDYLLWPAGVIVQLSGGTLDLGVTRDSVTNVANDFQVFTETFDGHAIIGSGVISVTGVNLCPNGNAANNEAITCVAGS